MNGPLDSVSDRGWGSALRTVVLYMIVGVMGWVGVTINHLANASSAQNVSMMRLQTQFESLQSSIVPLNSAMPSLSHDVDSLMLRQQEHERRITDLENRRQQP